MSLSGFPTGKMNAVVGCAATLSFTVKLIFYCSPPFLVTCFVEPLVEWVIFSPRLSRDEI
jgi:hypothetical protein